MCQLQGAGRWRAEEPNVTQDKPLPKLPPSLWTLSLNNSPNAADNIFVNRGILFIPPPLTEIEPWKFYNKISNALNTADKTQIRWATPKTCKLNKVENLNPLLFSLLVPIADKFVLINNDTMGIKLQHVENDGKWM